VPDEEEYEPTYTDVVYSDDGRSVTIFINGTTPVLQNESRALSRDLAMAGHDYFEVAFWHPRTDTIARASWGMRDAAGISGVYRTSGGINYGFVSDNSTPSANAATPLTNAQGAAILFVGKKTDKTLLAVGKLVAVDNGSGNITVGPAATTITADTISITFQVDALKSGVVSPVGLNYPTTGPNHTAIANSSFMTASKGSNHHDVSAVNTDVRSYTIGGLTFPMFKLTESILEMCGEYTFRIQSDVPPSKAGFDAYTGGIILAQNRLDGKGAVYAEKKQPRYPMQGEEFQGYSLRLDGRTEITPINNFMPHAPGPFAGEPFQNPVRLCFNTAYTDNGSTFALVFWVPVYPLRMPGGLAVDGSPGPAPGMWVIRPSYDSYALDLDDGRGGTGGAILINTGEIENPTGYRIRVEIPPYKFLYGNTTDSYGRDFDIRGLVVRMEWPDGTLIRYIDHSELTFVVGGVEKIPGSPSDNSVPYPSGAGYTPYTDPQNPTKGYLNNQLYGLQTVLVNFRDDTNGTTHTDAFPIICNNSSDTPNWASIPEDHIYVVTPRSVADNNTDSWILAMVQTGGPGTYVIIAPASFNFTPINMPANNSYLIIIVAGTLDEESSYSNAAVITQNDIRGEPSQIIRIGKGTNNPLDANSGNGTGNAFIAWRTTTTFYFGKWPFNSRLEVTPNAWPNLGTHGANYIPPRGWYKTYPYIVNAGGPIARLYNYTGANPFDTVTVDAPPYAPQATNAPSPPGNNYFLKDGFEGHIYGVIVDEDNVKIMNPTYLR
jgi:hypothetical protein